MENIHKEGNAPTNQNLCKSFSCLVLNLYHLYNANEMLAFVILG